MPYGSPTPIDNLRFCKVEISTLLAILVNVLASLALVLFGVLFCKEKLTPVKVIGILVCLAGLVMLNMKR